MLRRGSHDSILSGYGASEKAGAVQIFEKPRFLLRGRWGAGTEMSLATLVWNLRRTMAVPGNRQLLERLALA